MTSHGCLQVVLAEAAVGRGAWQHVPYRTCKLTHVLKDCLGGNCATLLIANVWGEDAQLDETLSTCRWGAASTHTWPHLHANHRWSDQAGARHDDHIRIIG